MTRVHTLSLVLVAACGGTSSSPGADAALEPQDAATAQIPPTGRAALEEWLATGAYLTWTCEATPHPARPPSAHGENRICSNDAIATTPTGAVPAGAASVKELYDGTERIGFAVAIKQQADSAGGTGWYWFENFGGTIYADGEGVALCTGCHQDADDYVFTRVQP